MKQILSLLFLSLPFIGCSDSYDKLISDYEYAIEELHASGELDVALSSIFFTEQQALHLMQTGDTVTPVADGKAVRVLQLRDSLMNLAEMVYRSDVRHFIEKRTVLYCKAADCYSSASRLCELDSLKAMTARFSAMAYSDGQRSCDPPAAVRGAYRAAREHADKCYRATAVRLGASVD